MKLRGKHVRELRQALGLSQEQLGVKAGTTGRTIARIELEEGPVNKATLIVVAEALGVEPDELVDEEPVAT